VIPDDEYTLPVNSVVYLEAYGNLIGDEDCKFTFPRDDVYTQSGFDHNYIAPYNSTSLEFYATAYQALTIDSYGSSTDSLTIEFSGDLILQGANTSLEGFASATKLINNSFFFGANDITIDTDIRTLDGTNNIRIKNIAANVTNPSITSDDEDTGIGADGSNSIALIAGGILNSILRKDAFGSSGNTWEFLNLTTAPSSNPVGGGFLYVEDGAIKWRGSSGTVTTIGNA